MLFFTILDNIPNLFLIELIFICPIATLFTLFIRIFFKISIGPSSQLLSIVFKVYVGFNGLKSKAHFGQPTLFHNFLIVDLDPFNANQTYSLIFFHSVEETVRLCKTVEWNSATTCNISVQLLSLKVSYLAQQPTQSADFLSNAQATHPFKFCCAYIVKKEGFHMRLKTMNYNRYSKIYA